MLFAKENCYKRHALFGCPAERHTVLPVSARRLSIGYFAMPKLKAKIQVTSGDSGCYSTTVGERLDARYALSRAYK